MHQNDVFILFFKDHFWDQYIKTIQNIQKKLNFLKTRFAPHSQTSTKSLCLAYT
jgi:hypothetical protein